jgi:hypothetical protein
MRSSNLLFRSFAKLTYIIVITLLLVVYNQLSASTNYSPFSPLMSSLEEYHSTDHENLKSRPQKLALAPSNNENRGRSYVVWLLSFPNSGTSYTIMNTHHITNMTAATNHGQEVKSLIRVRPDIPSPFLLMPELPMPRLVLTKTHCYGFCFNCWYV